MVLQEAAKAEKERKKKKTVLERLELSTSRLTAGRANQLRHRTQIYTTFANFIYKYMIMANGIYAIF